MELICKGDDAKIKIDVNRLSYLAQINSKIQNITFIATAKVDLSIIQHPEKKIPSIQEKFYSLVKMEIYLWKQKLMIFCNQLVLWS